MTRNIHIGGIVILLLLLATGGLAAGLPGGYHEDFSTKVNCDTENTTALWDTETGELKPPPFELSLAGSIDTPGHARAVHIRGSLAYVADRYSGLRIIDLSDPANPTLVGAYNTTGIAYGIAVDGDHAYVMDDADGVHVIDVVDPGSPTLIASYDTPGYTYDVEIDGDHAYIAAYDEGGLQVLNISDPANPVLAGSYDTPSSARGLILSGQYVFIADLFSGLQVLDISNPANPVLAGSYDTPGEARMVDIDGNYAYVADSGSGVQVIDVSDPANPTLAGGYLTPDWARDIAIAGNDLYVAVSGAGLLWLDISDPTNPVFRGLYDTPAIAQAVDVTGGYVAVADYQSGLQVIDRTGLSGRSVAQSTVLPGSGHVVEMKIAPVQSGNVLWEASADGGTNWQVITGTDWNKMIVPGSAPMWRATLMYPPDSDFPSVDAVTVEARGAVVTSTKTTRGISLQQNHPNPFNPTTKISFLLSERAPVELSVYNLQGQLVRKLVDGVVNAGSRSVAWDGTDATGNPVASGVYFYRLRSGKNVHTKKMILLK
jgi:hypothetical protein